MVTGSPFSSLWGDFQHQGRPGFHAGGFDMILSQVMNISLGIGPKITPPYIAHWVLPSEMVYRIHPI